MTKIEFIQNGGKKTDFIKAFGENNVSNSSLGKEYDSIKNILSNGNSSNSSNSSYSNGFKNLNKIEGFANIFTSGIKKENLGFDAGQINTVLKQGLDFSNVINGITETIGIYQENTQKLFELVNEEIGMSGNMASDFRDEIRSIESDVKKVGVGFDDLLNSIEILSKSSGTFKILDKQSMINMADASRFVEGGIQGFAKLASETEKYSLGVNDTAREVTKMMKDSIELGLNYKKVIESVSNSLDKLNMYGFKNGIQGLSEMSRKAIQFRMDINDTFSIAEKVWSPEGAVEMTAKLQMLGGVIGDFNDPIKMMYMATNNVEGLQDALIESTKSLATFNSETGTFEVIGANLRIAKEKADAMGVSLNEVSNIAKRAAERSTASMNLLSSGLNIKEEDKDFLTNLSRMEGGEMVISVPENLKDKFTLIDKGQVKLSELTEGQIEQLKLYKKDFEKLTPDEIGKQQVDIQTNINRNLAYLVAKARYEIGKSGEIGLKELFKEYTIDRNKLTGKIDKITGGAGNIMEYIGENIREASKKGIDNLLGNVNNSVQNTTQSSKVNEQNKSDYSKTINKNETSSKTVTENKNVTVTFKTNDAWMDNISREWARQTNLNPKSYIN